MGHDKDGDVPELVPEFRLDPHWEDAQKLLNLGQVFVIVIFVLGLLLQLLILVSGNLFVLGRADLLPNFEDVVKLNLEFVDKLCERYRFEPSEYAGVRHVCGLSSLEYDPYNDRLYLMASFEIEDEAGEQTGGYLWSMPLDDLTRGVGPSIVEDAHGEVLEFEHKAEGLAVLDTERLFVAYDNDRDMTLGRIDERDEREACEAPYTVLRIIE